MRRTKTQCLLLTLLLLLGGFSVSACGKKGPLYLPDKAAAPQQQP